MKRFAAIFPAMTIIGSMVVPTAADTQKSLADIAAKASGAMAYMQFTYEDEVGSRTLGGICVCIEGSGVMMTTSINSRIQAGSIKDLHVILPGLGGKRLNAKFLGVDPLSSLGFIQVTDSHKWSVVRFARSADLNVGTRVISMGLLGQETAFAPYMGVGYVSTTIRVPGELVYVTGGTLTGEGSPVFTDDGLAVGVVGRQLFLDYQTTTSRGPARLRIHGQQRTSFFTPASEFAVALEKIPAPGRQRRLPWMGVLQVDPVSVEFAKIVGQDKPAVILDRVLPGFPAAKAGLQDRDVVIAMNGKDLERLATPELVSQNFLQELMKFSPGQKVTFTVVRGRQTKTVTVTMVPMPPRPDEAKRYIDKALGFGVREKVELDEHLLKGPEAKTPGVLVILVGKESPAARGGLNPDDLITHINDQPTGSVDVCKTVLAEALKPGKVINFLVYRGGQQKAVSIRLPAR